MPEKISKQLRWQRKKIAEGKCPQCGGKPVDGGRLCIDCGHKYIVLQRERTQPKRERKTLYA